MQLVSHRDLTASQFTEVNGKMDQMKLDYEAYTDRACSDLKDELMKEFNKAIDNLKYELERLRAEFEQHKNKDFRDLENRVSALEKKLQAILDRMANMNQGGPVMDDGRLADHERRITALEDALENLRNQIASMFKDLQDQINAKPDFDQIEKMIHDRLAEIVKALTKQFADKGDVRKNLKMLEKQLQNLYNVVMNRVGGEGQNEEDAMFSKKPLKGLSCASCEKGLENMYGKRVEFMAWNKLPFRDPAERIARVG